VKVLRRCVRDMASKSSAFVELCVKTEKEAAQEVGYKHAICWRWRNIESKDGSY
jgi:hypothetical protein